MLSTGKPFSASLLKINFPTDWNQMLYGISCQGSA